MAKTALTIYYLANKHDDGFPKTYLLEIVGFKWVKWQLKMTDFREDGFIFYLFFYLFKGPPLDQK